jgi:hypothetical protein
MHRPHTRAPYPASIETLTNRILHVIPLQGSKSLQLTDDKDKKAKSSLCLTNQALLNEGVWGIYPHFFDLGTSWRWVVNFTPQSPYPRGNNPRTHQIGGWVGRRAGVDEVEKILDPTGTRNPTPSVLQPVASPYTDCAIPAPANWWCSNYYFITILATVLDSSETWSHTFSRREMGGTVTARIFSKERDESRKTLANLCSAT